MNDITPAARSVGVCLFSAVTLLEPSGATALFHKRDELEAELQRIEPSIGALKAELTGAQATCNETRQAARSCATSRGRWRAISAIGLQRHANDLDEARAVGIPETCCTTSSRSTAVTTSSRSTAVKASCRRGEIHGGHQIVPAIAAKRIDASAEDGGVEGTLKRGKGPIYRQRMAELDDLQRKLKITDEPRLKEAQRQRDMASARIVSLKREIPPLPARWPSTRARSIPPSTASRPRRPRTARTARSFARHVQDGAKFLLVDQLCELP
jgi:hypothetical protein